MKGPRLGPGGEDITWPEQVAPRGRMASSTHNHKPQTSHPSSPSRALHGLAGGAIAAAVAS